RLMRACRHSLAVAALLVSAHPARAVGVTPGRPPAFGVQIAGRALRQYRPGPDRVTIVSDDALKATRPRVAGDEWELAPRPRAATVTAVWYRWEPDKSTSAPRPDTAVVYYPQFLGVAVRASLLSEWGWRGALYPGDCFAPLVVVADETQARMVAATNWPPRRVRPMYSLGRIGLRYDDPLAPGARRTYRALILRTTASANEAPWQSALDVYKAWLADRMRLAGLRSEPPGWMRQLHGWLNIQLQNIAV